MLHQKIQKITVGHPGMVYYQPAVESWAENEELLRNNHETQYRDTLLPLPLLLCEAASSCCYLYLLYTKQAESECLLAQALCQSWLA